MIRLVDEDTGVLTWVSPTFTLNQKSGTAFDQFTVNHNQGRRADVIRLYSVSNARPLYDFFTNSTHFNGYRIENNNINGFVVNTYRQASGFTGSSYWKVFWLDSDSTFL